MKISKLIRNALFTIVASILIWGWFLYSNSGMPQHSRPGDQVHGSKILNVKDFGAKGNGVADDTFHIQKALDMAHEYVEVYFPEGVYLINPQRPLIIKSKTTISGDGNGSIIKADAGLFGWDLINIKGHNIEISNISFDGNNSVNRVLVIRSNSSHIMLEGITVANASQSMDKESAYHSQVVSGIIIYGNTGFITINHSEIYNLASFHGDLITRGIYMTTTWNSIEDVPKQITITNSYIHNVGPADDGDCIYYEDAKKDSSPGDNTHSLIADNQLEGCAKRGIKLYADGVTVSGNHIVNSYLNNNTFRGPSKNGAAAPDMYAGISVYGDNNTIEDNTLDGKGSFYAAIEVGAVRTVNNITISNNIIKMGDQSRTKGTTGIRIGNITDFIIEYNEIINSGKAIWAWQNAEAGIIASNSIQVPEGGGIDLSHNNNYSQQNMTIVDNIIQSADFTIRITKRSKNVRLSNNKETKLRFR